MYLYFTFCPLSLQLNFVSTMNAYSTLLLQVVRGCHEKKKQICWLVNNMYERIMLIFSHQGKNRVMLSLPRTE